MTEDPEQVGADRDELRAEVKLLAAQLQHLVRAEHALTRARRDSERQIDRIRRLADFALQIAGAHDLDEVMGAARNALLDQFELDEVVILQLDSPGSTVTAGGVSAPIDAESWERLISAEAPGVGERRSSLAAAVRVAIEALGIGCSEAVQAVVWVPIRPERAALRIVAVGWTSRCSSNHRDVPRPEHVPFLRLFGDHVTRALDNVHLTQELKRQGAQLAESNQQLSASLKDLEKTQTQLGQSQKLEAIGRLAGGIAHDFNNLLTVIMSHADLLRPEVHEVTAQEDLAMIVEGSRRAHEITKRLLAFGQKREHRQQAVDLNAATTELSRVLRRLIKEDVTLQLDLDPSVGRVCVDPVALEQIAMNLVVNARDAMPQGGRLTIETRHARESERVHSVPTPTTNLIALVVRDTGVGMDEATRRQLFEPFFTTKPLGQGTGLGLATVYGLVQQNHGEVVVTSEQGRGSTFAVLLPSAEGVSLSSRVETVARSRGTVLVAEDEDAIRRLMCRVLSASGFEVVEARDGKDARDTVHRVKAIDLLVTDVVMPNLSGPELARALREQAPELKVVFMSGHTFDQLDVDRLDASREIFLAKPFTPNQLLRAVDAMLPSNRSGAP